MMNLFNRIISVVTVIAGIASCTFPNDMSYPIVPGSIVSFDVEGSESVKKSYPDFFSDIEKLGIKFTHYEI